MELLYEFIQFGFVALIYFGLVFYVVRRSSKKSKDKWW